jgi:hypothetical protein
MLWLEQMDRSIKLELHDIFGFYIFHFVQVSYIIPHLSEKGYILGLLGILFMSITPVYLSIKTLDFPCYAGLPAISCQFSGYLLGFVIAPFSQYGDRFCCHYSEAIKSKSAVNSLNIPDSGFRCYEVQ